MKEFRQDNTEGYTEDQLKIFNHRWAKIVSNLNLKLNTAEYNVYLKNFNDHIAKV